ncbi:MAG TPA: tRNA (adenosine(37)-N6)-threonylcarbamoyltransferase complex ATPase subunit type 1 TsaE [Actinomycetota bacterium]|nr:tRNA (adenosine(37)-N6)-threonylcarbamoyltransferase complex ATPase subunit type 1 TsaE [Actinomycetota bacterium]
MPPFPPGHLPGRFPGASSNHRSLELESGSPEQTRRLAMSLSPLLHPGDVVALGGDLGAGKTTFVQGLAAGLGIPDRVTSPTFILMREYLGGRYPLIHMDVYRLERMQEVVDLGYDEFLDPGHIVVVEWGDMVEPLLPKEHLSIHMRYGAAGDPFGPSRDTVRQISLRPHGALWEKRMQTAQVLVEGVVSPSPGPDDGPDHPRGEGR